MTDKISSEDFIKAFGGGIKHNLKRPQVEKEPVFKSVPTYRKYEDYHDAEQYVRGWNDAMRYIFGIEDMKGGAKLYREETCKSKESCDDYKYWHCVGCNGCKKGGAE